MLPVRPLSVAARSAQLSRRRLRPWRPPHDARVLARGCSCSATPHVPHPPGGASDGARPQPNPPANPPANVLPSPATDHRALAQVHNLFTTSPYSPGSPLILPNGAYVFQKLQAFLRAQYPQFGFQEVITPIIYKKSLWKRSGHWDNYAQDMFSVHGRATTADMLEAEAEDDSEFGLKPMNCPGHCLLFKHSPKSYRELPVRLADFSALHRNEISGALSGLTRVRRFHQDDAHIFCRPDQILAEIEQTLKFVGMVYNTFGLGPYKLVLSTRPQDSFIGTAEEWERAEMQLTAALNNVGREWSINEGDGAFYGPKIDIILKDSHGKEHQTATIQLDFQLPQRFDLQYQASPDEIHPNNPQSVDDGLEPVYRRPVIIHRAIYGSIERFMALLIEHYATRYPFWLSPRPAIVLALNSDPKLLRHVLHIQTVLSGLTSAGGSAETSAEIPRPLPLSTIHLPIDTDTSDRPLGKKIAEARAMKYNHIIIVGKKEVESGGMSLQIVNQPDENSTYNKLEGVLDKRLSDSEKSRGIFVEVAHASRYFKTLVNSFL
ncbi:threonyl-tRNA synthetase [Coniothyrium glycines]